MSQGEDVRYRRRQHSHRSRVHGRPLWLGLSTSAAPPWVPSSSRPSSPSVMCVSSRQCCEASALPLRGVASPPTPPPVATCQQGAHTHPTSIHPQGRPACESPRPFLLASTSSAIGGQDKQPTTEESPESG